MPKPERAKASLLSSIPVVKPKRRAKPASVISNSASVDELLAQAAALYDAGLKNKAEKACWKAVQKVNPRFAQSKKPMDAAARSELYRALSHALQSVGDHMAAADAAALAFEAEPHVMMNRILRAAALYRAGRWEDAAGAAADGLKIDAKIPELLSILADCHISLGTPEKALAAAEESLKAAADNPGLLHVTGRLLAKMGATDGAIEHLSQAAALAHSQGAARLKAEIGHILSGDGRFEEARQSYQDALSRNPGEAAALHGLINALHADGQELEAHNIRQKAMQRIEGFLQENLDFYFAIDIPPLGDSKALLVNGLGVYPAVPLGVASIKAYVEANSDYRVTAVDLNALHYKQIIEALRNGTCAFTLADIDEVREAFDAVMTTDENFFQEGAYKKLSEKIVGMFSFIKHTFDAQFERAYHGRGPAPWSVQSYARHLLGARPQVIGFSVNFPSQLAFAAVSARMIKALSPETSIVFGGGLFTPSNLEGFLAEPFVDYVAMGEGESSFLMLMDALNGKGEVAEIAGIAFRQASGGHFIINDAIQSLKSDDLPFADFSDFDLTAYYAPETVFPALSSSGCYWRRCTFCNHFASYAGTYKASSIKRFVDELAHHAAGGVTHFTFVDEMLSAKRLFKISEEIIARKLDIKFYALAKPTSDFTAEILKTLKQAGCLCIYWGQESGSQRMLALMDKGNDVESSSQTLRLTHQAGINNHLFLIVGYPSETLEDLRMTLDFLYQNRAYIDAIVGGNFVLCEGTPVYSHYQRFGIRKIYPVRSLSDHRLVDYEIEGAINQKTAEQYAAVLHLKYFSRFSRWGIHFGTPRDHIITLYSHRPDLPSKQDKEIPHPDQIWPLLDDENAAIEDSGYSINPRWY